VLVAAGCATNGPEPLLPPPTLELPAPVASVFDNVHDRIYVLGDHLVIVLEGGLIEVGADGSVLPSSFPDHSFNLNVRGDRAAFIAPADGLNVAIGRLGPQGAETSTAIGFARAWKSVAAAPDGAYYQLENGKLWGWTSGAPVELPWTVPANFSLMAADTSYLYGDEGGPIVRYDRTTGIREEIVSRGQYDYESLVMFALHDQRLMYRIGRTLYTLDLATMQKTTVGEAPLYEDYAANFAFDDTRSFYGAYRFRAGASERLLGAPDGELVNYSALLGDQIAWLSTPTPPGDPSSQQGNSTLYIMNADAPLE
jgi:hypothetical protein